MKVLNKRKLLHKPRKTITVPVFERPGCGNHIEPIESIIKSYFKYKKFNNVKNSVNKIYGIENFQQITKILENSFF